METTKYYGVEQSCYGHIYRYIIDGKTLSSEIYGGGPVPDEDVQDCGYPIGGSNSGSTSIMELEDLNEIRVFLTVTPWCEYEDPTLCDIAEFLYTPCGDHETTRHFMRKCHLTMEDCSGSDDTVRHRARAAMMIEGLRAVTERIRDHADYAWDDLERIDFKNPFYGDSADLRFSELSEIYKRYAAPARMTA